MSYDLTKSDLIAAITMILEKHSDDVSKDERDWVECFATEATTLCEDCEDGEADSGPYCGSSCDWCGGCYCVYECTTCDGSGYVNF